MSAPATPWFRGVRHNAIQAIDAQRFAATAEADVIRGDWINPRRGKETIEHWAKQWLGALALTNEPDTIAGFARQIDRIRAKRKGAELRLRQLHRPRHDRSRNPGRRAKPR